MKIWYNNIIDTDRRVVEVQGDRIRIGRAPSNEIVLDSPYVADEAAVLYRRNNGWELVALGMNGITLDDRQLYGGERCDIRGSQTISLFPYSLTLDLPSAAETTREHQRQHDHYCRQLEFRRTHAATPPDHRSQSGSQPR